MEGSRQMEKNCKRGSLCISYVLVIFIISVTMTTEKFVPHSMHIQYGDPGFYSDNMLAVFAVMREVTPMALKALSKSTILSS